MPEPLASAAVLLELPVSVVKRADRSGLEPSRNAMEVESVLQRQWLAGTDRPEEGGAHVANTPSYCALFTGSGSLIRLTLDTFTSH